MNNIIKHFFFYSDYKLVSSLSKSWPVLADYPNSLVKDDLTLSFWRKPISILFALT